MLCVLIRITLSRLNGNIETYMVRRNKASLLEQTKKKTYQSKIEDGKDNPKAIWKLLKKLGANGKASKCKLNINIKIDDTLVQNNSDFTELFSLYFINIASNLKKPIISPVFETLKTYVNSKVPSNN